MAAPRKFNIDDKVIPSMGIFRGDTGTVIHIDYTKIKTDRGLKGFFNKIRYTVEFEDGHRRFFYSSHLDKPKTQS